ncbi:hypothetical protein E2562_010424 [Oryza meyeriana var. granulata]|uniref:Uncharacterized protein n=1 Tax=Oryza meyeriana var. granulata TaxID=110450 RepID=A0A6G1F6S7_9ORYZ|nr:hypothetical protein E2562_010424 [Oryza meyeriana var. granulata]
MDGDAGMFPLSSSAESSPSSSDIDTESTGSSFFRDRSTTLGTLMGVSFADEEEEHQQRETAREGGEERERTSAPAAEEGDRRRWRRRWRRRRWRSAGGSWWRLCRDDVGGTTSLGQFLHMERQLAGAGLLCGDGGEERESSTPLFDNGIARPPLPAPEERAKWQLRRSAQGSSSSLVKLPVLLTAICSSGA